MKWVSIVNALLKPQYMKTSMTRWTFFFLFLLLHKCTVFYANTWRNVLKCETGIDYGWWIAGILTLSKLFICLNNTVAFWIVFVCLYKLESKLWVMFLKYQRDVMKVEVPTSTNGGDSSVSSWEVNKKSHTVVTYSALLLNINSHHALWKVGVQWGTLAEYPL